MENEKELPPAVPAARSLVRKLSEVMAEIDRIPKSGRNAFHNYAYATEADIVDAVRGGLAKRGVMAIPDVRSVKFREVPGRNGAQIVCRLRLWLTFEDGDTGETRVVKVFGEGQDPLDKGTFKAFTGAMKYALLKTFLISTGDDPEADDKPAAKDEKQQAKRQRTPPPQNEPPPPGDEPPGLAPKAAPAPKALPAPKPGSPYAAILEVARKYGLENHRIGSTIHGATGKTKTDALTPDDVARFEASVIALRSMPTGS